MPLIVDERLAGARTSFEALRAGTTFCTTEGGEVYMKIKPYESLDNAVSLNNGRCISMDASGVLLVNVEVHIVD